jgi:hypothetical protein
MSTGAEGPDAAEGAHVAAGLALQDFPRYTAQGDMAQVHGLAPFLAVVALVGLCIITEMWLYVVQAIREADQRQGTR